jgi:peptidoglycan/xylan/chitin deacetylase (PgdA/CDA1 family)
MKISERDFIGYGQNAPNPNWPKKARLAINFVINVEEGSEYSPLLGDEKSESGLSEVPGGRHGKNQRDLAIESIYEYGSRVGFWRITKLLEINNMPYTFFVCALTLLQNKEICSFIRDSSSDICCHGYRWEEHYKLNRIEEKNQIKKAFELIFKLTNKKAKGWYCRYAPSENTRDLLIENGNFLYDSDSYNDDLPYWVNNKKKKHLVIPYALDTNDVHFKLPSGFSGAKQFYEYVCDSINFMYKEGIHQPKLLNIGLHPRLIGRPGRIIAIEKIIRHIKSKKKIWVCRREDVANHWINNFYE